MTGQTGIFFQQSVPLNDADCVVLGLPWDGTVSGRSGARFGPRAIREASLNVEDYSPYLDRDISEIAFFDCGDMELPFGDTKTTLNIIKTKYTELIGAEKKIIALGGEHLVTLPMFEALYEKYGERLFVLQFDAHADLREDYLGVAYSHATVMNHIVRTIGIENTAVVGVRSGTRKEWEMLRSHPYFFSGISSIKNDDFNDFIHEKLMNRVLYITIDLDVFDPSTLPGTGTPEPGGIFFKDFIGLMKQMINLNIVGADIVELAPDYDHSGISNALAATVLRELLLITGIET